MQFTVQKIAGIIGARVIGDDQFVINGVNGFQDAGQTDITFAYDLKFLNKIDTSNAGAIIVPEDLDTKPLGNVKPILLFVDNPKRAFFNLVGHLYPPDKTSYGIHPSAIIGDNVKIGQNIIIEPGTVVSDNVVLGDNVHLMPNIYIGKGTVIGSHVIVKPNVTINERSRIGSHVIIHSGSVIGSDGYGFTQTNGEHQKIIHTGIVEIGDNVEIGACNTIDRGTLRKTIIGNGVKTDNLVHIAHNVKIGDNSLIVAQVGIAGSTTLGKNVIVAGKAGISGHLKIGDNTIIGPYAGVHSNIDDNQIVSGVPQMEHKSWRKAVSVFSRLPEIRKKILSFEKRIKKLEDRD